MDKRLNPLIDNAAFDFIESIIMLSLLYWELILSIFNYLGIAWWAKVETDEPQVTYWFGPFLTKNRIQKKLGIFLNDLKKEGNTHIKHHIIQCKSLEPLTTSTKDEIRHTSTGDFTYSVNFMAINNQSIG